MRCNAGAQDHCLKTWTWKEETNWQSIQASMTDESIVRNEGPIFEYDL